MRKMYFIYLGFLFFVFLTGSKAFAQISVSETIVDASCNGVCDGSISLSVSGGISPYSFNWSNSASTQNLSALCAGNYSVTISDNGDTGAEPFSWTYNNTGLNAQIAIPFGSVIVDGSAAAPGDVLGVFYDQSGTLSCGGYNVLPASGATVVTAWGAQAGLDDGFQDGEAFSWKLFRMADSAIIDLSATYSPVGGLFTHSGTYATQGLNGIVSLTGVSPVSGPAQQTAVFSYTVNEPAAISMSLTTSDYSGYGVSTNGASDGFINSTISGGTSPYGFLWSNTETTQNISALVAGTYSLVVTDNLGCTATSSAEITEPASVGGSLTVSGIVSNISCNSLCDGAIDISVSGGNGSYNYLWSNSATTEDLTSLCSGSYSVTVSEDLSVPFSWSFINTGNNHTIGIAASALSVDGAGIQVGDYIGVFYDASGTLACGGYTQWTQNNQNQGSTAIAAWGAQAGQDDGFQFGETFTFKYYRASDGMIVDLTPTFSTLAPNGSTYVNNGMSIVLSLTGTSSVPSTGTFSGIVSEPSTISLAFTGSDYSGYGVSSFGATDGSIDLTVSGGTSPFTYSWSNSETSEDLNGIGAAVYSVSVFDANQCSASGSYEITEPASILPLNLSGSATDISCNGLCDGSVDLIVSGGLTPFTYSWSNQATTQDLSGLCTGTYSVTVNDASGQSATTSFLVNEPVSLALAFSGSDYSGFGVSAYGASDGSIDLSVSGGTSPYTYIWSNTHTTEDLSGLTAATYSVTVFDANQCSATGSYEITSPTPPISLSGTASDISCNGLCDGSIDLTISGGTSPFTISWSNNQSSEDLSGLCSGTYTVTVVDNGTPQQMQSTSFSIAEPASLSLSLNTTDYNGYEVSVINGTDGAIDLTVTGGTQPYSFIWSGGQTSEDLDGLGAGMYSVTVYDANQCSASISATLSEPLLVASGNAGDVSCNGLCDGTIDLSVSGGITPYTYLWSNNATTQNLSGLCAGNYSVTITDGGSTGAPVGGSFSWSFTTTNSNHTILIQPGTVSIDGGAPATGDYIGVFYDHAGTLTCGGYIQWTGSTTALAAMGAQSLAIDDGFQIGESFTWKYFRVADGVEIDLTATYMPVNGVTIFNGGTFANNGMSGISTLSGTSPSSAVTQQQQTLSFSISEPTSLVLSTSISDYNGFGVSQNGATDGSVDLTVSGGTTPYAFSWSNSETVEDLSGIAAGSYSVTVTDANLCTATTSVTLTQPDNLAATGTESDVSCNGLCDGSIDVSTFGGVTPYNYFWSNGANTEDVSGLCAGSYSLTIYDNGGTPTNNSGSESLVLSFTISEPAQLLVAGVYSDVTCANAGDGSIDITVNGGTTPYLYSWSNNSSNEDLNGLGGGQYSVTVSDANNCTASESFTIAEPNPLTLSETLTMVSCNGAADGAIQLTLSGGTNPLSFGWSNGEISQDLSNLTAGTYSVTLSDLNSCSLTGSFTITEPAALSVSGQVSDVQCNGDNTGAIDLSVSGGTSPYFYSWNNQESTQDLSALIAGNYMVTVSDANACTATASFQVSEPAALSLSETIQDILCNGAASGAISTVVSGGVSPYSYSWSNNETNSDLQGLTAGTYQLVVTDQNSCTLSQSYTLTEPDAIQLSANLTDVLCYGDQTGSIDLSVQGGVTPYTYSWDNGSTNEDLSNLYSGSYLVTVSDANACSSTGTYSIGEPYPMSETFIISNVSCNGLSDGDIQTLVSGGTYPYSYVWSNGGTSADINNLPAASYTVTITDDHACTYQATAVVDEPLALSFSPVIYSASCNGENDGAIYLNLTGGTYPFQYTWSNGGTDHNNLGIGAGSYSVTVVDSSSCSLTQSFTVGEPDAIQISGNVSNLLCYGAQTGAIDVSVSGGTTPYLYTWSNGESTEDLTGLSANTYTLTVTDDNGCSATSSFIVTEPDQMLAVEVLNHVSCNGLSDASIDLTLSGGTGSYMYNWNNGSSDQDLSGLAAGTYSVTISDANSCQLSSSYVISEPDPIVVSGTQTEVSCYNGNNGGILVNVSGGTPGYSYTWSNGATISELSGLGAGNYSLTLSDANSCSASASYTITQPDQLLLSGTVNDVNCFAGSDGSVVSNVSGGTQPYSYIWSNGQSGSTLTAVWAGAYSLTVSDANQCQVNGEFLVEQPSLVEATNSLNHISCNGANDGSIDLSINGGVTPYTYSWSNGSSSEDLFSLAPATYSVTVTDSHNCTLTESMVINEPDALSSSISATNCTYPNASDGSVNLSVSGGSQPYSYVWNNGATTQDLSNIPAGTYEVTISDYNNCSIYHLVTITQPAGPGWTYTVTGTNHTVIIPVNADLTVNGNPVQTGDYIGVFYDSAGTEACGGYTQYLGTVAFIAAWGAQANMDDGFQVGEEFTWKIWSNTDQTVYPVVATYMPVDPPMITDQQLFAPNGISGISVLGSNTWAQLMIPLPQDWSIVSLNLYPDNMGIADIFAPVVSNIIVVKNEAGAVYFPFFGINLIGNWNIEEGYKVNMINADTIYPQGEIVDPFTTPVNMASGWNLISYLRQSPGDAAAMVSTVASDMVIMKDMYGWVYWPLFGFNTIGDMEPGRGYEVFMLNSAALYYPANTANVSKSDYQRPGTQNYPTVRNTGSNMTLAIPDAAWDVLPENGDEIGVYTETGKLVGSSVYESGLNIVPVWGDDELTEKADGLTEQESFVVKLWNHDSGKEYHLNIEQWERGNGWYENRGISIAAKVKSMNMNVDALAEAMPNPARSETKVLFTLSRESNVRLSVYSLLGEEIELLMNQQLSAGDHEIILNVEDYPAGLYFIHMETESFKASKALNVIH